MSEYKKGYKFKLGDKVRLKDNLVVDHKYGLETTYSSGMKKAFKPGSVVTIRAFNTLYKGCYGVEGFCGNYWSEEMFDGLVIDAETTEEQPRPKFKVGDRVVGNAKTAGKYTITKEGWKGTVTGVYSELRIQVSGEAFGDGIEHHYDVDADCFDLLIETEETTAPAPELHTDWNWEDLF